GISSTTRKTFPASGSVGSSGGSSSVFSPSCVSVLTVVSESFSCGGGSSSTGASFTTGGVNFTVSLSGCGGGGGGGGGAASSGGGSVRFTTTSLFVLAVSVFDLFNILMRTGDNISNTNPIVEKIKALFNRGSYHLRMSYAPYSLLRFSKTSSARAAF